MGADSRKLMVVQVRGLPLLELMPGAKRLGSGTISRDTYAVV